jgi:4,5-dihydroxyphthalate decarboxylase
MASFTRRRFVLTGAASLVAAPALAQTACAPQVMKAMMGDYPNTRALKAGAVASSCLKLDFAQVRSAASAFPRVVNDLEFDIAELSIVTFLIAKSLGVPMVLMPAVMFARIQHPYLVYDTGRGRIAPKDLEGRRVGVAYYTTTTSTWLRHVLATDHSVDVSKIRWVALSGPQNRAFQDPANVERLTTDKSLVDLLKAGTVDAIVIAPAPDDPRFAPVIDNPRQAAVDWHRRTGAIQLNHLVAVKQELTRERPDLVREAYRMLLASKAAGGPVTQDGIDLIPYGLEANRRNLDVAIDAVHGQGMIPRRYAVEELFDPVTASLARS